MKLTKEVLAVGFGAYYDRSIIISDLHFGYAGAKGTLGYQYKQIVKQLDKMLKQVPDCKRIIINGDLKDEFGKVSDEEWRYTLRFIDYYAKDYEIILIKGNHDNFLSQIAEKRKIVIKDHILIHEVLVMHGDKQPSKDLFASCNTIIIGHEHPSITLKKGAKSERFKCFLKGKHQGKTLIVLPAFNPLSKGFDILQEKPISPLLPKSLSRFQVFIVGDEVYDFGSLSRIQRAQQI